MPGLGVRYAEVAEFCRKEFKMGTHLKVWWDWLFPPASVDAPLVDRSVYERLPLPHVFKPRLSLSQAAVATLGALLRIFLGSCLFALWGTSTIFIWQNIPNFLLRAGVLVPLFVVFLLSMALLMSALGSLFRAISPKHS